MPASYIDLLWKIKQRMKEVDGAYIHLNLLINDDNYRRETLNRASASQDAELRELATRAMQEATALEQADVANGKTPPASTAAEQPTENTNTSRSGWLLSAALVFMALVGGWVYFGSDLLQAVQVTEHAAATPAETLSPPPAATPVPMIKQAQAAPAARLPAEDARIILRLHGSNTVGEKLAPELVAAYLESIGAETTMLVSGATPVEKQVQALLPGEDRPVAVEIHAHGSSTSFKGLAAGKADLGMASRPIKGKENETLKPLFGDMTGSASEHVVGLDGLAVIVHSSNPVNELTSESLAAIFSGQVTDWSQVGGKPGPITLYARDDKSGTYDTFKSLVLKKHKVKLSPQAKRFESNSRLSDSVAADPSAIGFTGLPYVRNSKLLAVADSEEALAILPTAFTVGTEDYPLARRLFLYNPPTTEHPHVKPFVEFALSKAGQDIVKEIGFVSQNIYTEDPPRTAGMPTDYLGLTQGAQRLSLNFRFQTGSRQLDNKALRDLNRLVEYMGENPGRQLILMGFTDNIGDPQKNRRLSLARAQIIETQLAQRGIVPQAVQGFGEALPVASNTSDYGRNKNRRVEVWIR